MAMPYMLYRAISGQIAGVKLAIDHSLGPLNGASPMLYVWLVLQCKL